MQLSHSTIFPGKGSLFPRKPQDMHLGSKLKKLQSRKVCLHFNASPRTCSSVMASSHSISRRQSLQAIASSGHVYTIAGKFDDFMRNNGQLSLELSGIRKASTFGGFCAHHDNQIFSAIDKHDYEINGETAARFYYRALCREFWVRQNAHLSIPALAEKATKFGKTARHSGVSTKRVRGGLKNRYRKSTSS